MNEEENRLREQLLQLGFPDHQLHDFVFKLRGVSHEGEEIILLEHPFECTMDLTEILQQLTRGNVLQKLSSLTTSEYSWCFRPTATFDDIEEFAGRIARHIFDNKSSSMKSYEFLVETLDGKIQVVKQVSEYRKELGADISGNTKGIIGPTGYFNFVTK